MAFHDRMTYLFSRASLARAPWLGGLAALGCLFSVGCGEDPAPGAASTLGTGGTSTGGATATGGTTAAGMGGGVTGGGGSGGGIGGSSALGSLSYTVNAQREHDYGLQTTLPSAFGTGEFTLEVWIKPDDSFPVGPVGGGREQLTNWSDVNVASYADGAWWYQGNFLLDGHNNNNFASGTFSLQFYDGGRLRWMFGDQGNMPPGGVWAVGAGGANPRLLDGSWH